MAKKNEFWIVHSEEFVQDQERFEKWVIASITEGVQPVSYEKTELTQEGSNVKLKAMAVKCKPLWRRARKRYLKNCQKLHFDKDGLEVYFPPKKKKA